MKTQKSLLFCALTVLASFSFLFVLRTIPVTRIWNDYAVVYADKSLSEDYVASVLEDSGCSGIVRLGVQQVPVKTDFLNVIPDYEDSYISKRAGYFYDKTGAFRVFYVPSSCDDAAVKAVSKIIRETGKTVGLDGKGQFPWLVPVIALSVAVFFLVFTVSKGVFAAAAVPFLLLCFSAPFYTVAAASVLFMLSVFLIVPLLGRRNFIKAVSKSAYILVPAAMSLVILAVNSWRTCILGILCAASSVALVCLVLNTPRRSYAAVCFSYIFSATQISVVNAKNSMRVLFCAAPLFLIFISFILSSRISVPAAKMSALLPVPVSSDKESELPLLDDFYKWSWYAKSLPYVSMNDVSKALSVRDGDTISVPRFSYADGHISESESVVMEYGPKFRSGIDEEVSDLSYASLEKFLLKQDDGISVVYGSYGSKGQRPDILSLLLIAAGLAVPVVLFLYYNLFGRKNYEIC